MPLPKFSLKTYGVIYADPRWQIMTWSARGKGRAADAYYDTMDLDAIKTLPVGTWAKPDAVLLLWAHNSMLPEALGVMTAWGFTYRFGKDPAPERRWASNSYPNALEAANDPVR
jgi:N6-adenosine-specific RNA methylase IME4